MCGIFGFIGDSRTKMTQGDFKRNLHLLFKLSERRGREAAGLVIAYDNKLSIYKQPRKSSAMLKGPSFKRYVDSCIAPAFAGPSGRLTRPIAVIGHTRLVTNGSQAIAENNQPIRAGRLVGVHNGIITNDMHLADRYPEIKNTSGAFSDSDTRVLLGLIEKYYAESGDVTTAVSKVYKEITGSASIALFSQDMPALTLATNTGSLYFFRNDEGGFFVFGSERFIVKEFLRKNGTPAGHPDGGIAQLMPSSGVTVSFEDISIDQFSFSDNVVKSSQKNRSKEKTLYEITDESSPHKSLIRCTRCVLPETYPFIYFDENGVCNYCRDYKKQEFLSRDALERILEKYRSKDGSPDCIVGFSGGRDSSYGLHVLKKELGMHPIAYTYDWAMVTELSRRNQAKVTGKLGVEHLIRAADIHMKRRYIRKNIYAWLKRPRLGMVTLFMAGDKMFYYYGRQLRKETGIKLTVFSAGQQLEQMEFKVGFCGVNQHLENNTKLYQYKPLVKTRLALWYIWQYIMNPRYFNESAFDSLFAFYSSFINKDDYLYLYRYIKWDEKVIEKTLKEEYDWEADEKYGKNQWRMGDGHTAFINYIWYTIAGFSEFDNFRSNQIREGLITRSQALLLVEEDNKPRIEMLQAFSQLIGFNLEEVLLKIGDIPKLY